MKKILLGLLLCFLFVDMANAKTVGNTLKWDANIEADLAGYRIYQGTISGGPYTKIGEVIIPTTTYNVSVTENADKITTFYFVVTAFDTTNLESDYSNQVSVVVDNRTSPAPPKNLSWLERVIAWIKSHWKFWT